MLQKGHECKATQRVRAPVHLHVGPCHSRKHYRPKFCGECGDCCSPQLSTTIKVDFVCPRGEPPGGIEGLLGLAARRQGDLQLWGPHAGHRKTRRRRDDDPQVIELNVQWILKCSCTASPCPGLLHRVHRTAALHRP
ncbi:hypothetical protein B566_EDAN013463 [Ephemera danica]|nr:hypothetical protein B566_EDAN013463 [Ephemera danica]